MINYNDAPSVPKVEEKQGVLESLAYTSNALYSAVANNTEEGITVDYQEGAREFAGLTKPFKWTNEDVAEEASQLPEAFFEEVGEVRTYAQYHAQVARFKKRSEAYQVMHEELGTAGTLIGSVVVGAISPENLLPFAGIRTVGRALNAARVSNKLARGAIQYTVAGAQGVMYDELFQQAAGTDSAHERVMAFTLAGAISGIPSHFLDVPNPHPTKVSAHDPITDVDIPLSKEDGKNVEIINGKLEIDRQHIVAKGLEEDVSMLEKDVQQRTAQHKLNKSKIAEHTEYVKEAKAKVETNKRVHNVSVYQKAKKAAKEAAAELKDISKKVKGFERTVKALSKKKNLTETQQADLAASKASLKEAVKETKYFSKQHEIAKRKETKAYTKVKGLKQKDYEGMEVQDHDTLKMEADVAQSKLEGYQQKAKTNAEIRAVNERMLKETKSARKSAQKLKVTAETNVAQLERELKELEEKARFNFEEAGKMTMEVGALAKRILITPTSKVFAGDNVIAKGIMSKLAPPMMAMKDAAGNYVKTRKTARDFKRQYASRSRALNLVLTQLHKQAKEGGYEGTLSKFHKDTLANYHTANAQFSNKALENMHLNFDDDALIKAEINKRLNEGSVEYKIHKIDEINLGSEAVAHYFKSMAKDGQALGVKGFEDIVMNGYFPRHFDKDKLGKNLEVARNKLYNSMRVHPGNQLINDAELWDKVDAIFTKASHKNIISQMTIPMTEASSVSTMNKRTIYYTDNDMAEFLSNDLLETVEAYSYTNSGRFALQQSIGASDFEGFQKIREVLTEGGATAKELDYIQVVIDTIAGTREIMKNPESLSNTAMRIVTKSNFMQYALGFGLTATSEVANIIASTGFKNTIGMHFDSISAAFKAARGEQDLGAPWINELRAWGLFGEILDTRQHQRFDAVDSIDSTIMIEKIMDKINNRLVSHGGLAHVTEASRALAMGSGFNMIVEMAGKMELTKVDQQKLARLGLDVADLKKIQHLIDTDVIKYNEKGHLTDFNFHLWNKGLADDVQNTIMRHMESTILHPDGMTLPVFMSDPNSFVSKVMMQFFRFPIAAHETLMLRGMTEFDANQAVGIVSSMMLFSIIAQVKDLGAGEARYDMSTDEGRKNLLMYLGTNGLGAGPLMSYMEKAYATATGEELAGSGRYGISSFLGPAGNTLRKAQTFVNDAGSGDLDRLVEDAVKLSPVQSLPVLGNILKEVTDKD